MLGYLAEITGDYARAARLHREGLRMAEDLGLWTEVSYRLSSLGRVALLTGDVAQAKDLHERGPARLAAEQSGTCGRGVRADRPRPRRPPARATSTERGGASASAGWNRRLEAEYGVPYYGVTLLLAELGFVAEQRGDAVQARALHLEGADRGREGR